MLISSENETVTIKLEMKSTNENLAELISLQSKFKLNMTGEGATTISMTTLGTTTFGKAVNNNNEHKICHTNHNIKVSIIHAECHNYVIMLNVALLNVVVPMYKAEACFNIVWL